VIQTRYAKENHLILSPNLGNIFAILLTEKHNLESTSFIKVPKVAIKVWRSKILHALGILAGSPQLTICFSTQQNYFNGRGLLFLDDCQVLLNNSAAFTTPQEHLNEPNF